MQYCSFFLARRRTVSFKKFDEYIKISRQYLPKSDLRIVTNGLLIPSTSQKILDSIRENNFFVSISNYPPTAKILDKIETVLNTNKILYDIRGSAADKKFSVFLSINAGHNPMKTRAVCNNNNCRFLRDGRIYKCPIDALKFRLAERFGIKNFPASTSVDIYSPNFSSLFEMLDGNVEMCNWCGEKVRQIDWEPSNNPKLEDWLADPAELQNFR